MSNFAVLGTGVGTSHISALLQLSHFPAYDITLSAIVKSTGDFSGLSQKRIELPETVLCTTDPEKVFRDQSIDSIVIATPDDTHYELGKKSLESGKHTLIEKPYALTRNHARELREIASEKGLLLDDGTQLRVESDDIARLVRQNPFEIAINYVLPYKPGIQEPQFNIFPHILSMFSECHDIHIIDSNPLEERNQFSAGKFSGQGYEDVFWGIGIKMEICCDKVVDGDNIPVYCRLGYSSHTDRKMVFLYDDNMVFREFMPGKKSLGNYFEVRINRNRPYPGEGQTQQIPITKEDKYINPRECLLLSFATATQDSEYRESRLEAIKYEHELMMRVDDILRQ